MMGGARGRSWWRRLVVPAVLALALSPVLLHGGLQSYRDALTERGPNDGVEATFFVFHGTPNFAHPEDFYFYALRAKRIAERGSNDDLFAGEGRWTVPRNPLQYAVGRLVLATDGAPAAHAGLWFALLLLSHLVLYRALSLAFPHTPGLAGRLAIVSIFATCPTLQAAVSLFADLANTTDPAIWPGGRMARLSTYAWSNGLFAAILVVTARVARDGALPAEAKAILFLGLLALAGGDIWAFALAFAIVAFAILHWFARLASTSPPGNAGAPLGRWIRDNVVFIHGIALTLAVFALLGAGVDDAALDRGGIGPLWRGEGGFHILELDRWYAGFLVRAGLTLAAMAVFLPFLGRRRRSTPFLLALPVLAATLAAFAGAEWHGVQFYQMIQFHQRIESGLWLAVLVVAALAGRRAGAPMLRRLAGAMARPLVAGIMVTSIPFAYTALSLARVDGHIRAVAARDGALPKRLEDLRDVVACLETRRGVEDVATLNPELNHLMAYWTGADLILPVGFPLHYGRGDAATVRRMGAILRLYRVTREAWSGFPLNQQTSATLTWPASRLLSARQSYLYWLFHHAARRDHDRRVAEIADALEAAAIPAIAPRLILEDEVSRALGRPSTRDHEKLLSGGGITLWLRLNDLPEAERRALRRCASDD